MSTKEKIKEAQENQANQETPEEVVTKKGGTKILGENDKPVQDTFAEIREEARRNHEAEHTDQK